MRVLSTRAGRSSVLLVGIVFSLLCFGEAALAQKRGGVLRMFHRDNPPSTSILEEFSPSTPNRGAGTTTRPNSPSSCAAA
jgi:hypothetical protein